MITVRVLRAPERTRIVRAPEGSRIVRAPALTRVVRQGGVRGLKGDKGDPGGVTIERLAAQALGGHRVVKAATATQADYASADQAGDAELVLGVTTGAASSGEPVTIQAGGEMVEGSWAWSLGPVFLGLAGQLTQTPPTAAFIRQIGVAVAPDRLLIDLRPPIVTT